MHHRCLPWALWTAAAAVLIWPARSAATSLGTGRGIDALITRVGMTIGVLILLLFPLLHSVELRKKQLGPPGIKAYVVVTVVYCVAALVVTPVCLYRISEGDDWITHVFFDVFPAIMVGFVLALTLRLRRSDRSTSEPEVARAASSTRAITVLMGVATAAMVAAMVWLPQLLEAGE